MKTINLFFDMEFTSLSPDAQIISLGIVSEEINPKITGNVLHDLCNPSASKSMYCEFTDFDINRCDQWVKLNVISKLRFILSNYHAESVMLGSINSDQLPKCPDFYMESNDGLTQSLGNTSKIKEYLKQWLSQFSDYNLQFISDCGTDDWWHLRNLLAEWEINDKITSNVNYYSDKYGFDNGGRLVEKRNGEDVLISSCIHRIGLPKLPANISPVPFDLNDLIAIKKGITPLEAFDLNRESLMVPFMIIDETTLLEIDKEELLAELRKQGPILFRGEMNEIKQTIGDNPKHNSLWDAKVIKEIYNKLK